MCRSQLHDFLHALPKCELHVHVEGCLTPDIVFDLAKKNAVNLPADEDPAFRSAQALRARYKNFSSLDDFLHYHFIGFSCLQTSEDFEYLAFTYLSRARSQNVLHAEVFFDPQAHTVRGVPFSTIVKGLETAKKRAAIEFPDMSVAFIPCMLRHLPVASAHDLLAEAVGTGHFDDGLFVGFGMSSSEQGNHPSLYKGVFEGARVAGISNLTAHYGEDGPAEYVAGAISELGVRRIDHGIRAIGDPALIERLADSQTHLTLCPISNVELKTVARLEDVPIRQFLNAGVSFSFGSDDPGYFDCYVLENYCAVQEAFNLNMDEWVNISRAAIKGSWCNPGRKAQLLQALTETVSRWDLYLESADGRLG
ncbi:hypothetical protein BKA56DRAFT_597765 [Ilyonectria sp. MPI-CAGE-AT-0026]|nr:hypothetical protein BKA56DRAFT_597765 [Ilyonectria sp. MPI-CAGE-AT-0026]